MPLSPCFQWLAGRLWTAPQWQLMSLKSTAKPVMGGNTAPKELALDKGLDASALTLETTWAWICSSELNPSDSSFFWSYLSLTRVFYIFYSVAITTEGAIQRKEKSRLCYTLSFQGHSNFQVFMMLSLFKPALQIIPSFNRQLSCRSSLYKPPHM